MNEEVDLSGLSLEDQLKLSRLVERQGVTVDQVLQHALDVFLRSMGF